MSSAVSIRGYDHVEFYVGSAKMVAYWYAKAMGFSISGYCGPETGVRDRTSYYLTQNNIKIVLTSAVRPHTHEIVSFITQHGDGVKRWALDVDDVESIYSHVVRRGAIPLRQPHMLEDQKGYLSAAAIRIYDDTELVFVNRDHYEGVFCPGFENPIQDIKIESHDSGLLSIDHIVGNVRTNEMNQWAGYYNKILDFETFVDFGPGDISTKYSALLSKVVRSPDGKIKLPINEPYKGVRKSQIEEYIQEYHGSGIQHIALASNDIIASIRALRENGVEFLSVPPAYYEDFRKRSVDVTEDIDQLEKLGILCDIEGEGYLLQLFTKPIGDRPTFFFEIIQRRNGSQGFGQGNFQALFESIERDQEKRGNL